MLTKAIASIFTGQNSADYCKSQVSVEIETGWTERHGEKGKEKSFQEVCNLIKS